MLCEAQQGFRTIQAVWSPGALGWLGIFFFFFLAALCSMWDLSSLTRDQTQAPCIGSMES